MKNLLWAALSFAAMFGVVTVVKEYNRPRSAVSQNFHRHCSKAGFRGSEYDACIEALIFRYYGSRRP